MSEAPAAAPVTENGVPPATQEKIVEEAPGFKVFVGNLAYTTTDEGLKTFFAPVASDIVTSQVIFRGTRSAGYGFVAFNTEAAAQKAVEALNKVELDGRPVIVELAKPAEEKEKEKKAYKAKKRLSRRGSKAPPGEVTEAEANGDAPEKTEGAAVGSDEAAPKKKKSNNRSKLRKAKAKITGDSATPAAEGETPAANGDAAEKKAARVRKPRTPRPRRPAGEDPVGEPSKNMLFVANLGFNIDDAGLAALFTDVGITVNSARVVKRRWGTPRRSKGYGFVDVGDEENQQKGITALEGKEVAGRPIAVKVAVNTQIEAEEKAENEAPAAAAEPVAA